MIIRTYSELMRLPTFQERLDYLRLYGEVGADTFGFDRVFNQMFYTGKDWLHIRNKIITRDEGCDLGLRGYEIRSAAADRKRRDKRNMIFIHHMNPISVEDIRDATEFLLNPEYLICVSFQTHNIIHYGHGEIIETRDPIVRVPGDTCPWKNTERRN